MSSEPSPRPWRVMRYTAEDEPDRIIDANGDEVAIELLEVDAQLIVDAVNERDRLRNALEEICNRVSVALNCPRQGRGTLVEIEGLVHDLLKIKECALAAIGEGEK